MHNSEYSVAIKELPADSRPRERLQQYGPAALSDTELVAILLGGGYRNFSALQLAQRLLVKHDDLVGLSQTGMDELRGVKGVGQAKACQLLASFELAKRLAGRSAKERPSLGSPEEVAAILMPRYGDKTQEHVGILALDAKNRLIKETVISIGILDGSMVHPREVFRPAILSSAAGIILFHNHPSNDPTPSAKDIELTNRLATAGKLMGMELLDHIVVTRDRFVSLRRQGLMNT